MKISSIRLKSLSCDVKLLLPLLLLSVPSLSQAQNITVMPGFGTAGVADRTSVPASGSVAVFAALDANRSYECSADSVFSTSLPSLALFEPAGGLANPTLNSISAEGVTIPLLGVVTAALGSRLTFTPAVSGLHSISIINDLSAPNQVRLQCMETTLYGGYNTNANPFNFLELTNITGATVSGRVRAFDFDGTQVIDTTFSIPANRRFDIDIHSAAGANRYGSLLVTHSAPLGGLQGNVSQYSGPVSALALRASVPLSIRDQRF